MDKKITYVLNSDNCVVDYTQYDYSGYMFAVGAVTASYQQECSKNKVTGSSSKLDKSFRTTFEYDQKGRLSSADSPDFKAKFLYLKEDEKGNWLEKIEYHNGKPAEITIRNIIY